MSLKLHFLHPDLDFSSKIMGKIGEGNGEILIYVIYEKKISTEMGL